jgi:hypothetical protein
MEEDPPAPGLSIVEMGVALLGEFWCCRLKSDRGVVSTRERGREGWTPEKFREF